MTRVRTYTVDEVQERIDAIPRVSLAHLPTPLDDCPNLSRELGRTISIKRDDCTGLAFGGNKVRQHEFMLADAIAAGADCVIQGSAAQSNHSRQLAAACARLGLDVYLVPKLDEKSSPVQGNYLIDHLMGATILPIDDGQSTSARKAELAEELRAQGRRPYVVGMGATRSLTLGTVAYVQALLEIVRARPDAVPDWIFSATQGSTLAGLQLGCELLGLPTRLVGVCPMTAEHEAYLSPEQIAELAQGAAELLGVTTQITADRITTTQDYVGERYGVPTAAAVEAIYRLGAAEGILLDPVYSGKGFAGLLDYCRAGHVPEGDRVVFVHTGGLPALFSYSEELTAGVTG
ncbi:D-cysteine desulfhydrase family protein [Sphaerisporangium perillae]|uniref:D-cysteine desulfhydrase family protein n=1 Tax=Sphaerisporangium perillae TaxID=2935860 RepID=UPI00200C648A|nr:D-cysteine desulfhydrase family protein [Sphaerisporangium perillae]